MRPWLLLVVALTAPPLLQGCTRLPAQARLADPAAQALPYPALLPYDQLPHPASTPPATDPGPALAAAAADLRRRAALLQAAP